MLYLGIEFNVRNLTVRLDDDRVSKMKRRLARVLHALELTKKQLQSIIGVLVFAAAVIRCCVTT